jgi:hypothetical protein
MSESCPNCGSPLAWAEGVVRARTGHCDSCDRAFSVLEQSGTAVPVGLAEEGGEEAASAPTVEGLECEECGAPLEIAREGAGLRASCPDGHSSQVFMPGRGPRAPRDERGDRGDRGDRGPSGPSRARPCRECGGELRFTDLPDGRIQGECSSCGNRFTLMPKRDGPARSGGSWNRGPGGGGRGGGGGAWRPRGGGRRFDGPGRRPFARGPPRRRRDNDEDS